MQAACVVFLNHESVLVSVRDLTRRLRRVGKVPLISIFGDRLFCARIAIFSLKIPNLPAWLVI
jgi:hypothetical protein